MCILFPTKKLDFWMRLDVLAAIKAIVFELAPRMLWPVKFRMHGPKLLVFLT